MVVGNFVGGEMKSLKCFFGILMFFVATPLWAADSDKSEFWFQPKGGQISLSAGARSYTLKIDAKVNEVKQAEIETGYQPISAGVTYGLSDSNALGVYTDYGSETTKTTTVSPASVTESKESGMGDAHLIYNGKMGGLRFGADFSMSPEKHKKGSSTKDGDRYSGGMGAEPYLGYHLGYFGLKGAYKFNAERTTITQGAPDVENKVTGGDKYTITAYVEVSHGIGDIDFIFTYGKSSDGTSTPAGGTATSSGSYTGMAAEISGNIDVFSSFAILYSASYQMLSDYNLGSTYDKGKTDFVSVGGGIRATF